MELVCMTSEGPETLLSLVFQLQMSDEYHGIDILDLKDEVRTLHQQIEALTIQLNTVTESLAYAHRAISNSELHHIVVGGPIG